MRRRVVPLLRIGLLIGIAAFIGFLGWDFLLLDDALYVTGPIRLATAFRRFAARFSGAPARQ